MNTISAFRLTAALIALLALASVTTDTVAALVRHPERTVIDEIWRRLRYFTILTNLVVCLVLGLAALRGRVAPGLAAAVTLWIGIVGVVYHTLLAETFTGLRWWTDHGMHTAVPLAVAIWWLAFAPKSGLRYGMSAIWLAWPSGYVAYALVRGAVDGVYPYFFVDPTSIGWPMVGAWVVALALSFWLAGLAMIWLGQLMAGRT